MAKTVKTPRGFTTTRDNFLEKSQGVRPALGDELEGLRPAPWLPVIREDQRFDEFFVIIMGTIVGKQLSTLVPANGGAAQDVVYVTADVGEVLDIGVFPGARTFVAAPVTRAAARTANLPVGWLAENAYNRATPDDKHINYELQNAVATVNRYLVEFPLLKASQDAFVDGDLVIPDAVGSAIPYAGGTVEQVCGRVLEVFTILSGANTHDRLDLVRGVKGSGVASDQTSGIEGHLVGIHAGTAVQAVTGVRVNITLL